jgi:hypothetical protein
MSQDSFDKQHVRKRVANSLVDQLSEIQEMVQCGRLGWGHRFVGGKGLLRCRRKEDCTVPVRFEVYANVEALSSVVKVLDARGHATYRESLMDIRDVSEATGESL